MKQGSSKTRDDTIIDVAREAGVLYATVSRVGNGKDYVKNDKRERVLLAMTQLGYVGEILRGIDQTLPAFNYDMFLYTTHRRRVKELEPWTTSGNAQRLR